MQQLSIHKGLRSCNSLRIGIEAHRQSFGCLIVPVRRASARSIGREAVGGHQALGSSDDQWPEVLQGGMHGHLRNDGGRRRGCGLRCWS